MEGKKNLIGSIVILVTYLVGIIGFAIKETRELFSFMAPYHLMLVFTILVWLHKNRDLKFFLFLLVGYIVSFSAEYIGVHTGLLFGNYQYGTVLGLKFNGVPLVIGVNWLMLIYISHSISERIVKNIFLSAACGALLLTILDLIMEPGAVRLGFWIWNEGYIPFYNYVCWFCLSFILLVWIKMLKFNSNLKISFIIIISQIVFFLALLC